MSSHLLNVSWLFLSNPPDGGPDHLPFPVANETDPEIKVETLTGKDPWHHWHQT